MLGVPLHKDGSDSQDLSRTIEALIYRHGLTLVEALELDAAPDRARDQGHAAGPARLLHVPAPGVRAVRPGPRGADLALRRRVRVLRRRARPASAVAARDRRRLRVLVRARRGGGGRHDLRAQAAGAGREGDGGESTAHKGETVLHDHGAMQELCAERWRAPHGRRRGRLRLRGRDPHRRPAVGRRDPGLHQRGAVGAGEGRGPRAGRLRLAARRHEARPADGRDRPGADRLAGLRRAAGLPVARAPEPGRLLQGVGGRGHQPGHRPRARGRALLLPRGAGRAPVAARRSAGRRPRWRSPSRCSSAATTASRRCPTRPTAGSRTSTRPSCSRTCGRPSAAASRARHLLPGVRGHPRRRRAAQAGGHRRPRAAARSCWC